jgi:hypothetical protein
MKTPEHTLKKRNADARRAGTADVFPKTWPSWVRKQIKDFESTEKPLVKDYGEELGLDDAPDWVINMWAELFKLSAPSIKFDKENSSGPKFLGSFAGHIEGVLKSKNGLNMAFEKMAELKRRLDAKIKGTLTKQQFAIWVKEQRKVRAAIQVVLEKFEKPMADFEMAIARKLEVVKHCVAAAGNQPLDEKLEFFDAYTRALREKIFAEDGGFFHEKSSHERVHASAICGFMVYNWRVVNGFKNFGELSRWLTKQFGRQSIGSSDRLKKLCRRYGYNPGGAPGRPAGQAGNNAGNRSEIPTVVWAYLAISDAFKSRSRRKK